jgi:hypothetical protein
LIFSFLILGQAPALAAGDANTSSCPNESLVGFHEYLPDCRAYEMVTPVFKDGTALSEYEISEDGSRMIAGSLGVLAGSGSDTSVFGSKYELSRSASGWTVAGISPPASLFPAQILKAASPDLSQTLWMARSPSESLGAANFYLREPNGVMTEIGPLAPPSATAGPPAGESAAFLYSLQLKYLESSDDFSHVIYDLLVPQEDGLAWPGDTTTGAHSLYEYSGRGNSHPELVGVNDEGHLISSCETLLGSAGENDLYNAVSASGESVFFTALGCLGGPPVNEVYARLGQFPINTVPVSEPTFNACEECQTATATSKRPAVSEQSAEFAGASKDGSNVFFTTSQELLAGDTGENLYDYDFDNPEGHKIVRVSTGSPSPEVQGVARVSEDGSHVYFVAGARLTTGPREGSAGKCLTELSPTESAEEAAALLQEEKAEAVTAAGRCRPKQGADNLYVSERDAAYPAGRISFVASLCSGELQSGSVPGVAQCPSPSATDTEDWSFSDGRPVQATPDGRFLIFESVADLTEADKSAVPQVFEYDSVSEALVRVSRGSNSYQPQGSESAEVHGSAFGFQRSAVERVSPAGATTALAVSADGSTVVFSSSAALTAAALPASEAAAGRSEFEPANVYEYHSTVAGGGSIVHGDVYLISDGTNTLQVNLTGLDPSGEDVFFTTADRLATQDTDTQGDAYDARTDGGFAAPAAPASCEGEACQGSLAASPLASSPVSTNVGPSGNVTSSTSIGDTASPPASSPKSKPKPPTATRAQKLAKALRACRKRSHTLRLACERKARRTYGKAQK